MKDFEITVRNKRNAAYIHTTCTKTLEPDKSLIIENILSLIEILQPMSKETYQKWFNKGEKYRIDIKINGHR